MRVLRSDDLRSQQGLVRLHDLRGHTVHEFYFDWPDGWWGYTCYLHDVGQISDWEIFTNMLTDPLTGLIGFVMAVGLRLAFVLGLRKGRKQ
jgi:hypothetical protein